jgi:putative tricarboxylic transport membrane protein
MKASVVNFFRSGVIGILIGILPGIGGALANFIAYDQAKKASKDPDSFGQGNIQGIIASETANNASIGGALIPMLSLGIPGDAVTAALLGGLMLHGLQPGPLLIRDNPEVVYGIFSSYFIATISMFTIMMIGIKIFPTLLRIKKSFLLPIVLAAGIVGCYNLQYSLMDVWVAVFFGFIGFILIRNDFPLTPIVISLVLGKMLEENLRLALLSSGGTLLPLFYRPISLVFMMGALISVGISFTKYVKGKK